MYMIQTYSIDYRTQLCEFFSRIIESHKAYISHGELQMGIALDSNELAPNYKEMWLNYLDRQVENPDNTLLLYLENGTIIGFVLFGITNDGARPYGVIFDLSVDPAYRGKRIGTPAKSDGKFPGQRNTGLLPRIGRQQPFCPSILRASRL